jgi:N-acetylmuramoyl-L-alanine amidase
MKKDIQFFGIVQNNQFKIFAPQELEGKIVSLTSVKAGESQPPGAGEVDLSDFENKIIEVSGAENEGWIYSAVVVEEAGPVLSDFLRKVFCKDENIKAKCVLVIGHKKGSPGAVNEKSRMSEFEFNEKLASFIEKKVKNTKTQKFFRRGYETLPGDINAMNPDFVVSLHCSVSDGLKSGTEVLHHYRSENSRVLAEILQVELVDYLKLPDRGTQAKTVEDEGGFLLRYSKAPCVIAKPFFIDNDKDLSRAMEDLEGLAEAYAAALDEFSKTLSNNKNAYDIAI